MFIKSINIISSRKQIQNLSTLVAEKHTHAITRTQFEEQFVDEKCSRFLGKKRDFGFVFTRQFLHKFLSVQFMLSVEHSAQCSLWPRCVYSVSAPDFTYIGVNPIIISFFPHSFHLSYDVPPPRNIQILTFKTKHYYYVCIIITN